jgi:hypothetical protein
MEQKKEVLVPNTVAEMWVHRNVGFFIFAQA